MLLSHNLETKVFEHVPGKTLIDLSLFVTDVLSVDDSQFSITLYSYLGIRWHEPRLRMDRDFWNKTEEAEGEDGFGMDPAFLKCVVRH